VEGSMQEVNYAILNKNIVSDVVTATHIPFSSNLRDGINRTTKSIAQTFQ